MERLFLKIIFLTFGLIPILPFKLKPLGLFLGLLFGFYYAIKKGIKFHKNFMYGPILFFLYGLSLIRSENLTFALKYIETSLSLVLFPLFFILISRLDINKNSFKKTELLFYKTYFISVLSYSILIFIYIYHLGYFEGKVTYDYCISYLGNYFWGFSNHAIYTSSFLIIALFFLPFILKSDKNNRLFYLFGSIMIVTALFFLARKGVILAGVVSFLFYIFKKIDNFNIKKLSIIVMVISFLMFTMVFPKSFSRFTEIFKKETYSQKTDLTNSTSIRLAIYKCDIDLIKKSGLFGIGIGDVKDTLNTCFEKEAPMLLEKKYNTHNTYVNILIGLGWIGFLYFLYYIFFLLKTSIQTDDYVFEMIVLFFLIIFLFENVLDRQNGVLLFSLLTNFYIYKNLLVNSNEK
jgi:hypothetical protein